MGVGGRVSRALGAISAAIMQGKWCRNKGRRGRWIVGDPARRRARCQTPYRTWMRSRVGAGWPNDDAQRVLELRLGAAMAAAQEMDI